MVQVALPTGDVSSYSNGGADEWQINSSTTTNRYTAIDNGIGSSNTDYVCDTFDPFFGETPTTLEVALDGTLSSVAAGTGTLSMKAKNNGFGDQPQVNCALFEGASSVYSFNASLTSSTATTYTGTVDCSTISDFTDLRIKLVINGGSYFNSCPAHVLEVQLEIPDAGGGGGGAGPKLNPEAFLMFL